MKRFHVCMHHNTIDELLNQGEAKEKVNQKGYGFDSITEALDYDYPYHKDNYIIVQWDLNTPTDAYGAHDKLAEAYLYELDGTETNLSEFITY